MTRRRAASGQILVMFVGGLLLLLGVTALVIDIGFVLLLRRQEQNGADPGALAAARHIDPAVNISVVRAAMRDEACFYALANGFRPRLAPPAPPDLCDLSQPHDGSWLTVNYPPSASAGQYSGNMGHVEVAISRQHQSFFAGALGIPRLGVTASAVAARTSDNSNSTSLLALAPTGCKTGQISGNSPSSTPKVAVGGAVQVNSVCAFVPSPVTGACLSSGSAGLVAEGGSILTTPQAFVVGTCAENGGGDIQVTGPDAGVRQGAAPLGDPLQGLYPPTWDPALPGAACGGTTQTSASVNNAGCGSGGLPWVGIDCGSGVTCVTLNPGVYYGGWVVPNKIRVYLNPGIYIIAGGGIRTTGSGSIEALSGTGSPTDAQVMIYSTDNPLPTYLNACKSNWIAAPDNTCQGSLRVQATNGEFSARGIGQSICLAQPETCPYKGLLVWQDGRGSCPILSCPVHLGGGTSLTISGTVYAPTQEVELLGSSTTVGTAALQIISWEWKISGDSDIFMPWDKDLLYQFEAKGLVK